MVYCPPQRETVTGIASVDCLNQWFSTFIAWLPTSNADQINATPISFHGYVFGVSHNVIFPEIRIKKVTLISDSPRDV